MGKEVLAMYDVRGIQNYIFRTNKVREIIGASELIENIFNKGFQYAIEKEEKKDAFRLNWEAEDKNAELTFIEDESILMQVLFIGGGNAYAVFRDESVCQRINRRMSRYILDKTYSLQLAIATVSTELKDYLKDYERLQREMAKVKAQMLPAHPYPAIPIVAVDEMTGFPISKKGYSLDKNADDKTELVSRENYEKRKASKKIGEDSGVEKIFDNMVTEKGKDSILAIVHIDGNNLGGRIKAIVESGQQGESYQDSVNRVRKLSSNIKKSFSDTFEKMEKCLSDWTAKDSFPLSDKKYIKDEKEKKIKKYIRKIIVAGDDITFVCNASMALELVQFFLKDISQKVMFGDADNANDLARYGLSACAGIAYVNSHFPFSEGYKMAEECCESAKKRAKDEANKVALASGEKIIGNWVDFHICKHISTNDLEYHRKKDFKLADGGYLLRRPYYVMYENAQAEKVAELQEVNKINADYDIAGLFSDIDYFNGAGKEDFPKSFSKNLRNIYPLGQVELDKYVAFIESRCKTLPGGQQPFDEKQIAKWYDALEMMDLYMKVSMEVE